MSQTFHTDVTCMDCDKKVTWATDYEPDLDGEYGDLFRCITCAKKVDFMSGVSICLGCGSHYEATSIWDESCSRECGEWIDDQVDRAQERSLRREQEYLEAL